MSIAAWCAVPWFLDPEDSRLTWLASLPLFLAFGFAAIGIILGVVVAKEKGTGIMWFSLILLICFGGLFGINILLAHLFGKMFRLKYLHIGRHL